MFRFCRTKGSRSIQLIPNYERTVYGFAKSRARARDAARAAKENTHVLRFARKSTEEEAESRDAVIRSALA